MPVERTDIEGLLLVRSPIIEDRRGFFRETWRASELSEALGRKAVFKQNNHSRSRRGVLRGFHREGWDKLIYVPRGTAFCAVADPRPDSATFGLARTFLLGDPPGERMRLFVHKGLCNAFYCLTEVDYLNEVSEEFDPRDRDGIRWNDETLAVEWPGEDPVMTDADANLPALQDLYPDHHKFKK